MSFQTFSQMVARPGGDFIRLPPLAIGERHKSLWARVGLRYRRWFIAFVQGALIFCALILAWLIRFNFFLPYRLLLFSAAPVLIVIRLSAIARLGLFIGGG